MADTHGLWDDHKGKPMVKVVFMIPEDMMNILAHKADEADMEVGEYMLYLLAAPIAKDMKDEAHAQAEAVRIDA